ncbi:MAG: hypothetical protein ACK4K9_11555 [Bacteroidia bacterium]
MERSFTDKVKELHDYEKLLSIRFDYPDVAWAHADPWYISVLGGIENNKRAILRLEELNHKNELSSEQKEEIKVIKKENGSKLSNKPLGNVNNIENIRNVTKKRTTAEKPIDILNLTTEQKKQTR